MSYSLTVSATQNSFEIAPAGPTAARCIDLVDLGLKESSYQGKTRMLHKIKLVWITPHKSEDGDRLLQVSQNYTLSLSEASYLYRDLNSWRGKQFTDAELAEFELENLIGAPVFFNIVHNPSGGTTFANPTSFMPLPKEMQAPDKPADYVRVIDREQSWDVRSPNFKKDDTPNQQASQGQAVNQYQQGPPQAAGPDEGDAVAAGLPF